MANSTSKLLYGFHPWEPAPRTCGPLGQNDAAAPFCSMYGDTPGPLGVNDWADAFIVVDRAPASASPPAPGPQPEVADPDLTVSEGQVTFDAEGNDDPKSRYFSRRLHWPGGASGVTIARGYDMRERSTAQVEADLVTAGLEKPVAKKFAAGAGKSGKDAEKFVKENRDALGEISRAVQKKLFEGIYPSYRKEARRLYAKWTASESDAVPWEQLDQAIRDVLVDLRYQGSANRQRYLSATENDACDLIEEIESSKVLMQYEEGRHRVRYLQRFAT